MDILLYANYFRGLEWIVKDMSDCFYLITWLSVGTGGDKGRGLCN